MLCPKCIQEGEYDPTGTLDPGENYKCTNEYCRVGYFR